MKRGRDEGEARVNEGEADWESRLLGGGARAVSNTVESVLGTALHRWGTAA